MGKITNSKFKKNLVSILSEHTYTCLKKKKNWYYLTNLLYSSIKLTEVRFFFCKI